MLVIVLDIIFLLHVTFIALTATRLLTRHDVAPNVRMAWLFVIMLFPMFGCIVYFLFGEAQLGHKQQRAFIAAKHAVQQEIVKLPEIIGDANNLTHLPNEYRAPFQYLHSINQLHSLSDTTAQLLENGDIARETLIADMDKAQHEICVLYYIWLDDNTGRDVAHALIRAAKRGVVCRAMVDGLGSRAFLKSETWRQMQLAGVQTRIALPLHHWIKTLIFSRIDLRNHRKITVIDSKITHCGSQNCADAAFLIKKKFAPWVDIMMRFSGTIAAQMRVLFATDWAMSGGEILPFYASKQVSGNVKTPSFIAQVMGAGSTIRSNSTPEFLVTLIHSARKTLTISTPYFVPDATVLAALNAAAWRGISVQLIVPARNDSWIVAAASRSHYLQLLQAGVKINEFHGGLLHAKTLTIDGKLTLIGSTNLDLRSFDLNFENNILFYDEAQTVAVWQRQQHYLQHSHAILEKDVLNWSYPRIVWQNLLAAISPVL